MKTFDILAIGDITTDVFIKIHDADIVCNIETKDHKLCFNFGDKIPYDSSEFIRAVGNSANASVCASRLGLSSALFAYMGNDRNGNDCKEELKRNNVDISYLHMEEDKKTNHNFILWYNTERTILVNHEAFNYNLGDIPAPKWIYLSSVGETSLTFHNQIADFLEKNPETKMAFQPGTLQIKMDRDSLSRIYQKTEIFFCNVKEAQTILKDESHDITTLLKGISALGPKTVVITDGINGSHCFDGKDTLFMPSYPGEAYERTGAGDAFSATVVSALALGKTLEEALPWGPINATSVIKYVGSQKGLLTRSQIEEEMTKVSADYKVSKINS